MHRAVCTANAAQRMKIMDPLPWNARTSSSTRRLIGTCATCGPPPTPEKLDNRLDSSNGVFSDDSKFAHSFFALLRFYKVTAVALASIVPTQAVAAEVNSGVVPHFLSAIDHNAPPLCTTTRCMYGVHNQNVYKAFHSTSVVEAMPVSDPIGLYWPRHEIE